MMNCRDCCWYYREENDSNERCQWHSMGPAPCEWEDEDFREYYDNPEGEYYSDINEGEQNENMLYC